jgi:hypothetical protein
MKFNINKPLKEHQIRMKFKIHLVKLTMFFLMMMALTASIGFIPENNLLGIYNGFFLFLGGVILFFYFGDTFGKNSLSAGAKYFKLKRSQCKEVFLLAEIHPEIKNYIISVNREGRQLYNIEYVNFKNFISNKKNEVKLEEERIFCNKLYNELS